MKNKGLYGMNNSGLYGMKQDDLRNQGLKRKVFVLPLRVTKIIEVESKKKEISQATFISMLTDWFIDNKPMY